MNFFIGFMMVVSVYAIIKSGGKTILSLVPLVYLFFRANLRVFEGRKGYSTWKFIAGVVGLFMALFFLQIDFQFDALGDPFSYLSFIHPYPGERYIYSTIMSIAHYEGVETVSIESFITGFTGVSVYHFVEFWLGSLFKSFYNVKSDIVLFYFVFPLFKTFTMLTIISVFSEEVSSKKVFVLVLCILLCFSVLGFLWITNPISKYHLRDMIMLPMLVFAFYSLYHGKYSTALVLLIFASIEYILFIPVVFLTLVLFYNRFKRDDYIKFMMFIVLYVLFYFCFREDIANKYFDVGEEKVWFSIVSGSKLHEVYRVILLALLTYPIRLIIALCALVSFQVLKKKMIIADIGLWILSFFLGYHLLYAIASDYSLDAWQFKQIAVNLSVVAFIFVLFELVRRRMYAICVVVLLLQSDYKYPFGGAKKNDNYDFALEQKLGVVSKGKPIKGFFVDENEGLPEKWALFYYPTRATDYARSNDYRMYLFNYDISRFKRSISMFEPSAQPILNRIIKPLFPMNVDLQTNIRNYGVSIVWVNKKSKYLSVFKDKKPLHELESYYIFYLGDGTTKG
ncbi:hypothetical protein [Rufibacter psychrotolerans]|uniref:hypothetical protein n=1 Tax=Rufibacter psychrotolerans TaxID=2812556 RepID=UPI0019673E7A|nr:hypothetical protein [Rufibacter sp. SYSU D00308]